MKTVIISGAILILFLIYKVIKRQSKIKDEKEQFGDTVENIVEEIKEGIKRRKEEPFKISKEQVLRKISEMFPKADLVSLYYMGSGDDFEEFSNLSIEMELDKPIEHKNGRIQKYDEIEYITDYKKIEKFINLELSDGNKIENYIWEVFEKANNSPAFEGAGAHGTIYFYIKNNLVELQNNYWEYNYDDDGNIDWDQEENIIECEEEKF